MALHQNSSFDSLPIIDENRSISAAVSIVREAATKLDAFLVERCNNIGHEVDDNNSIDSELRRLGDSEDELRRELEALHFLNSYNVEAGCCAVADSDKAVLIADTDLPNLTLSSPASSVASSVSSFDFPPLPELDFENRGEHQEPRDRNPRLQELRCFLESMDQLQKTQDTTLNKETEQSKKSLVERLARIAYGRHEYTVKPIFAPTANDEYVRTIEGGACVALASVVALLPLHLRSGLLAFDLVIIPVLLSCTEVHLPHKLDETKIALLILMCSAIFRVMP